eukprot:2862882-Rhodomonas_salina.2
MAAGSQNPPTLLQFATRSPVLMYGMRLRICSVVSGTDMACAAAFNSLFIGEIVQPDWDAFQSFASSVPLRVILVCRVWQSTGRAALMQAAARVAIPPLALRAPYAMSGNDVRVSGTRRLGAAQCTLATSQVDPIFLLRE